MQNWVLPTIDYSRCTGCAVCVDLCPRQALQLIDAHPQIVLPAQCTYCGQCEDICAAGAVSLTYEVLLDSVIFNKQANG